MSEKLQVKKPINVYCFLVVFALGLATLFGCKEDDVVPEEIEEGVEFADYYSLLEEPLSFISGNGSQSLIPELTFNYPLDSVFEIATDTSLLTLKLELDSLYLLFNGVEQEIADIRWNNTRDTVIILPSSRPIEDGVYAASVELKLLMYNDENEWETLWFSNDQKNYQSSSIWNITYLSQLGLIKGMQFLETEPLNPYRPELIFDLNFLPSDSYQRFESINDEARYEFEINVSREGNDIVSNQYEIDQDSKQLEVYLEEVLCEGCTYTMTITGSFFIKSSDQEELLTDGDGEPVIDSSSFTFIGGESQDSDQIIEDNIDYQYPVDRQYHFLLKEYPYGYLKLLHHQDDLLKSDDNPEWEKYVRISTLDDSYSTLTAMSYEDLTFQYEIPTDLSKETIYKVELLEKTDIGEESVFHTIYIRTSLHDTFLEKIENNGPSNGFWRDPINDDNPWRYRVGNNLSLEDEGFGLIEIKGLEEKNIEPFLVLANDFENNSFYQENIYSRVYEAVEKNILSIESLTEYGVPPVNSVFWWQYPYNITLDDDQIEGNYAPNYLIKYYNMGGTVSNMSHSYFVYHHEELVEKALAYNGTDNLVNEIIDNKNVFLATPSIGESLNFPYYIEYVLPGEVHSSKYYHSTE